MGQAKQRGTQEQRIAQAQAKIEALRPEKLVCGACKTAFTDFDSMDTRNMRGINAAFGGHCPACGETVLAFSGEADAVADAMIAWQDAMGSEAKIGSQSRDGQHVPFDGE
ncbi:MULTISPECIES: hypothetical protein [Paraburkholderia]|uniref:Uncharacterized protein n=1 Tax=Paraburkholderia madseniana TaxID=2599607 RepID=A0AAP5ETX2_9BURK|nr:MULTISPECIES: hypothetical protein [Paraburkholderia]MCX4151749.1 hypothetical protein [Paraburkholderia madseniana]MDN7154676.1 hypothetical protein [Paraburkholderia sp. WS6]MDQ6413559.1 hypothetical protein [Paraburkholderia madseniana]